jgi:hypothetical protein
MFFQNSFGVLILFLKEKYFDLKPKRFGNVV